MVTWYAAETAPNWKLVAVVALVIALVVWMNNAATDPGTPPSGSGVNQETGAVVVGSGEQTLDTYIDFMCPICNSFEQTYGDEILDLVLRPGSALDEVALAERFGMSRTPIREALIRLGAACEKKAERYFEL